MISKIAAQRLLARNTFGSLLNSSRKSFLRFSSASVAGNTDGARLVSLNLFTKNDCSLCEKAKFVLKTIEADNMKDKILGDKNIEINYIDITKEENKKWFDAYCFDIPVLHVDNSFKTKSTKFMHQLDYNEVIKSINEI
ncbi:Mgp12p [Ascoidea rubescens DSM 1968]|uniref:Glutaredoxin-like protein n=1 Tax=Ascoidea rubescens DSM 1968 TaxID=1344418 RepID=A0A1D2VE01_9ASCO|nr:DUF836-domain-containing protein [Ascoidea rubescens DSM 1968]ODV59856.1 DUF836-domain-containing protein [Ascoidea rubescens DSM 1968]